MCVKFASLDLKLGEDPFLEYRSLPKRDYFDEFAFVEEQRRVGLGEQGKAVRQEKDNDTIAKLRVGACTYILDENAGGPWFL